MTREEEIINEAVDYSFIEDNFIEYDDCGDICDDRDFIQKAFEAGAKWADRTMIDKACKWLINIDVDGYNFRACDESFDNDLLVDAFRRAMEE